MLEVRCFVYLYFIHGFSGSKSQIIHSFYQTLFKHVNFILGLDALIV